jgi:hypothetical protein
MRPIQHDSYVAAIDDEARAELIRNALQDRQAQLVSWREEPMGGGASGSELYTVSGEATSNGTVLPWKFILKMFNHEGEGWQESSTDPMAWDFWKREWLVYQAPWIRDLRDGLVAPHCYGSGELGDLQHELDMRKVLGRSVHHLHSHSIHVGLPQRLEFRRPWVDLAASTCGHCPRYALEPLGWQPALDRSRRQ